MFAVKFSPRRCYSIFHLHSHCLIKMKNTEIIHVKLKIKKSTTLHTRKLPKIVDTTKIKINIKPMKSYQHKQYNIFHNSTTINPPLLQYTLPSNWSGPNGIKNKYYKRLKGTTKFYVKFSTRWYSPIFIFIFNFKLLQHQSEFFISNREIH